MGRVPLHVGRWVRAPFLVALVAGVSLPFASAFAEGLVKFRAGTSYLPNSSADVNDNINNLYLGCGVGFHRAAGYEIEAGYLFSRRPFFLGLRYSMLRSNATINAASGPVALQAGIDTLELVIGYQKIWRGIIFTPKFGYGFFDTGTFAFSNPAGTSFNGTAESAQSQFFGLAVEYRFLRILWGLEVGSTSVSASNFRDGGNPPSIANSNLVFSTIDFSGLYALLTLGIQF